MSDRLADNSKILLVSMLHTIVPVAAIVQNLGIETSDGPHHTLDIPKCFPLGECRTLNGLLNPDHVDQSQKGTLVILAAMEYLVGCPRKWAVGSTHTIQLNFGFDMALAKYLVYVYHQ